MEKMVRVYDDMMSLRDTRVDNWLFVQTPFQPIAFVVAYVIILYVLNKYMKNRQAYELKTLLYVYNFGQVIVSFYIFYEILVSAILSKYSLLCQTVDYSNDPLAIRMASGIWLYYITKIIDLIDTIIFVLRKKHNQITFLHVFHHISMVLNAYPGVRFVAGGQTFLVPMLNSFVHTIMYAYYGLSALGPSVQKYLWWKRYITQMQLIQFAILIIHAIINYFDTSCSYPKGFDIAFFSYSTFIALLFLNFYRESYHKDKSGKARREVGERITNGVNGKKLH